MKNYTSEYCGETSLQIRKECSRGKGNTFLLSIVLIGLGHHFQQLFSVLFPPPRLCLRRREDGEAVGLCFALAALRGRGSSVSCRLGGKEEAKRQRLWPARPGQRAGGGWDGCCSAGALCVWSERSAPL